MDVDAILHKVLHEIALKNNHDTNNIQTKAISSGGANFTTALFLATISTPGESDLRLFAKLAIISSALREKIPATRLFHSETIVYTEYIPEMERLQQTFNIPKEEQLTFPKFYGMSEVYLQETVVLEDLKSSGYEDHNRLKPVTWEYAKTAVTQLAKWHAMSMAFQRLYPEKSEEYFSRLIYDMSSDEDSEETGKKMAEGAVQVVHEEYRDRLLNFLENYQYTAVEHMALYRPRRKAVLAHGDYRPSNMMHRNKDGKLEIIVIDYQTVHKGCPTSDLVYFIFTGTDKEFRKLHYDNLKTHYYKELGRFVNKYNLEIEEVYPEREFLGDFEDTVRCHALPLALFVLPMVTVDLENAPKLSDDDFKMDSFAIKPNENYAKRFNDILEDLITWGVV